MRIQIITTTMRIIEVSQRATDPIGDIKLAEDPIEVLIYVVGDSNNRMHTKVSIKVIMDNTTIHMEATTKITIMVTTVVEAAAAMDVIIIVDVAMVKTIIKVMIITSTISIIVMMMTIRLNSMDHRVLYVVVTITHQNIVLRVNMTLSTSWRK